MKILSHMTAQPFPGSQRYMTILREGQQHSEQGSIAINTSAFLFAFVGCFYLMIFIQIIKILKETSEGNSLGLRSLKLLYTGYKQACVGKITVLN